MCNHQRGAFVWVGARPRRLFHHIDLHGRTTNHLLMLSVVRQSVNWMGNAGESNPARVLARDDSPEKLGRPFPTLPREHRLAMFQGAANQRRVTGIEMLAKLHRLIDADRRLRWMDVANGQPQRPAGRNKKCIARIKRPARHIAQRGRGGHQQGKAEQVVRGAYGRFRSGSGGHSLKGTRKSKGIVYHRHRPPFFTTEFPRLAARILSQRLW